MKSTQSPNSPRLTLAASRRQFLAGGSTVVVTVLAWPWGVLAEQRKFVMKERSLHELRLAAFVELLNSTFLVTDAPAGQIGLKLIEASAPKPSRHQRADASDAQNEKFSLIFSGPTEPLLMQRIYRFEHPKIGWFEMFIVPIVTEKKGRQNYEAIFNRPASSK